ncbi:PEPxxWA-CTERM sorting domain-containing protein [Sphingobium sp. DEHP117]|uniref:PEPxxWA-CTERM sorting domain-containing protein n=1 Tax=Sphingobium sp. DEHP117 TaxID=2993436 RepID=UPI0027D67A1A|nr:PEPxxWA-CTERM sorting domain-containing protein [Sphingobium sp. DEHP117]MDQ4420699.1 PEPxxWA-CTERM sorting domain-containing protein [Sphingobium sp. DEHP117]
MRKLLITTALAGAFFMAPSAQALTVIRQCAAGDISATPALTSQSCAGFYDGNLLNQSNAGTVAGILNGLLGTNTYNAATFNFASFQTLSPLNGATTVDFTQSPFNTKLYGMTLIGVHYGAGQGSPGYGMGPVNPRNGKAANLDTSAFYLFDAGKTGIDKLNLNWQASSNLTLFSTGTAGGVPEPATWALMILGFGGIGAAVRRGKAKVRVGYSMA